MGNAVVALNDAGAVVAWDTVGEQQILGFNVLVLKDGAWTQANAEFISAEFAGLEAGRSYSFTIDAPEAGAQYALEVVLLDGSVSRIELGGDR